MDSLHTKPIEQLSKQIRLEEIRSLYGGTPFSYTASFIIILIIFAVIRDHVTSETNLIL